MASSDQGANSIEMANVQLLPGTSTSNSKRNKIGVLTGLIDEINSLEQLEI